MVFYCLTLFPEIIESATNYSILGRARESGIIDVICINIRSFSGNKHKQVDDYPYGGGAGMVMSAQPIYDAYMSIKDKLSPAARVIYLTPQGKPFNQKMAERFAHEPDLVLLCGHYEGVDERVIEEIVTDEVSLGDFVLTGGELCAAAIIDAVARLVPGVLSAGALDNESFTNNLLEYPQYTRPRVFLNREVPPVLLSGNHALIESWRHEAAVLRTNKKRPDMLSMRHCLCQHENL